MNSFKKLSTIAGWVVFAITLVVYFFSAERTGSLWDCGEFILGAYKLQVVHPPGAPFFLLVGRIFTMFAEVLSDNPEHIAFSVNLMSSICTSATAMLVAWVTIILGKVSLVGREDVPDQPQTIAILGAGLVAGLATAFASSIWFSAVEGEVYAMSTFFTALTLWAVIKWFHLPDEPTHDRWLIFAFFAVGMSIGVHLLSLLTLPALALFYYYKKFKNHTFKGMLGAAGVGVLFILGIQMFIIVGIPSMLAGFELFCVNTLGLPFDSGLIPTVLVLVGLSVGGLYYAHKKNLYLLQKIVVSLSLIVIAYSIFGVVIIRAGANTPVNMNQPDDALRLMPYLNREQYGERPLLYGPHFDTRIIGSDAEERYGRVGDGYEIVDQKISYEYDKQGMMLLPRIGHSDQGRPQLHRMWMGLEPNQPLPPGRPNQVDNMRFLFKYQLGWMYWRYFMWNFSGRQNGEQGYYPWNMRDGHWISGIKPLDEARLYNMDELPESMKEHEARNKYYLLPFLFGLLGLIFHYNNSREEFWGLLVLFIITGIGIIIYSNQPPNEPRERDYVLAGSFFTYCIWIGMGALSLFRFAIEKIKLSPSLASYLSVALVLLAPILMGFQNYDDHSRRHLQGARDYANNFLESCEPNAIIFTYGDNDTYPLWYAQEVEGIRTDVRVVNLSLISVDWYINQLRRKVNDSPPIKLTIAADEYRGKKRNQVFLNPRSNKDWMNVQDFIRYIGESHPLPMGGGRQTESNLPTTKLIIPVDRQAVSRNFSFESSDSVKILNEIRFDIERNLVSNSLIKGDVAILDILASNLWERPIYFSVTCRDKSLLGLQNYMQLEGLGLRIVPVRTKSDRLYGMVGKGRIDEDRVYDHIMNDFRWGNFDKYDMFVDQSFAPSIQAHRMIFLRAIDQLAEEGENQKVVELVDKYLEAFPHMNFPYNYHTYLFIEYYLQVGAIEKAKPHIRLLANSLADYMDFYYSLSPEDLESGFQQDFQLTQQTIEAILRNLDPMGDAQFKDEISSILQPYQLEN